MPSAEQQRPQTEAPEAGSSFDDAFRSRYASEEEVSSVLGMKISTLRSYAATRSPKGPPGRLRVGCSIFYNRETLFAWLASREVDPAAARDRSSRGTRAS